MSDQSYLSLAGAKVIALERQTALANVVMHLFQAGFSPTPGNVLADFAAHEATYDGYAAETIATWAAPVLAGVGYAIYAPTQTFRWVFATGVGNSIAGYYLVDAAGNLIDYCVFDSPIPMAGPDQAVIKTPVEVIPAGQFA